MASRQPVTPAAGSEQESAVAKPDLNIRGGAARATIKPRPAPDWLSAAATLGVVVAGVALFEVALVPGLLIGGAAVMAPRALSRKSVRNLTRPFGSSVARQAAIASTALARIPVLSRALRSRPARLVVGRAAVKTITFRVIVTTLDFSANYLVIGELTTAAGLSAFALVVGPLFYFVHEAAWQLHGTTIERGAGPGSAAVSPRSPSETPMTRLAGFTISRALAKTITYRAVATTMDFSANFVVVGDLGTAVLLSSFGFFVGPFVYYGHERAWEYFGSSERIGPEPSVQGLLSPQPV
jgi:uncharacterized membrane protein